MISALFLLLGLGLLVLGADLLVRGGAAVALRFGLPPLVVGLTVVAYGTSSPELVVSARAALAGEPAIAIGNVVGSNIANIGLILGLCALIRPLKSSSIIVRREAPIMIVTAAGCVIALSDGKLALVEGVLMLAGLVAYTSLTVRMTKTADNPDPAIAAPPAVPQPLARSIALCVAGLAALTGGAHLFVDGASTIASTLGVSQTVIGLTVVAVGTSLPELATSIVAVCRNQVDVAIGNVVGSNIFNVLGVLGSAAVLRPAHAFDLHPGDLFSMFAVAAALYPLARSGGRISRGEGGALLVSYVAYTWWTVAR